MTEFRATINLDAFTEEVVDIVQDAVRESLDIQEITEEVLGTVDFSDIVRDNIDVDEIIDALTSSYSFDNTLGDAISNDIDTRDLVSEEDVTRIVGDSEIGDRLDAVEIKLDSLGGIERAEVDDLAGRIAALEATNQRLLEALLPLLPVQEGQLGAAPEEDDEDPIQIGDYVEFVRDGTTPSTTASCLDTLTPYEGIVKAIDAFGSYTVERTQEQRWVDGQTAPVGSIWCASGSNLKRVEIPM